MIDVNDLDGLLELAKDYVDDGLPFLTEPVSYGDLLILVERIIAAEKDAARYRWLRDLSEGSTHEEIGNYPGDMWDEAIDEAMQCGGEENDHASEESRVDLEGLMFDLGNYKAMLGRAENVIFEAERVLEEYQKNGGIEFDDLIGEIAYYVKYMSKGECSDS